MRNILILLAIFITSFSQSQEYKITKLNGFNVRLFNSKVMIANDSISFTYRRRPPLSLKILKTEEIDNKKDLAKLRKKINSRKKLEKFKNLK